MLFLLSTLLVVSGACALIYEVLWTRQFTQILGATATANLFVFSLFLSAMAAGAFWWGRRKLAGRKALATYGILEIAAAMSALLSSFVILRWEVHLAQLVPSGGNFLIRYLVGGLLVFASLGPPCFFLGGALPVLLKSLKRGEELRRIVPRLYAWNTFGAATGASVAGLVLIWRFGIWATLLLAVGGHLVVGTIALIASKWLEAGQSEPDQENSKLPKLIKLGAFFSGFLVLGYEIIWARLARFLMGERTIATAILLSVFLLALALASFAVPLLVRRFQSIKLWAAMAITASFWQLASVGYSAHFISSRLPLPDLSQKVLLLVGLMAPPVLLLGTLFPLVLCEAKKTLSRPGESLGDLYLINTLGAVTGAFCCSLLMTRALGTIGASWVLTGVLFALALLLTRQERMSFVWPALALPLLLATGYFAPSSLELYRAEAESLLARNEDEYGLQQITQSNGRYRIRSNRMQLIADLGKPATDYAQQMAAHLPLMMSQEADSVLNIGTGYGITCGVFTLYDSPQSIITAELLPFLAEKLPLFADFNFEFYQDQRVEVVVGDGRHKLITEEQKYDIITVNVLDPYVPGSSNLYTVDFWREARSKLKAGGVYTQLIWGEHAYLLARGLESVFPTVVYSPAYRGPCYNVICFKEPVTLDEVPLHLERLTPAARQALKRLSPRPAEELLKDTRREAIRTREKIIQNIESTSSQRLHSDDFPILEYIWSVQQNSSFDSELAK